MHIHSSQPLDGYSTTPLPNSTNDSIERLKPTTLFDSQATLLHSSFFRQLAISLSPSFLPPCYSISSFYSLSLSPRFSLSSPCMINTKANACLRCRPGPEAKRRRGEEEKGRRGDARNSSAAAYRTSSELLVGSGLRYDGL